MIMGNIDTLMLSKYSDLAVAAVGNANQIMNTLIILFNVTSAATGIMVTQYIGAKQEETLHEVYTLAFVLNIILAVIITGGLLLFQTPFFKLIQMPQELYMDTKAYLDVVVGFLFVPALFTTFSVVLKSFGQTKLSMVLAIGMNLINVVGNYISLFGPANLPILGVRGVAISTVVSRSVGLIIMMYVLIKHYNVTIKAKSLMPLPKKTLKKFLKLGLPSAGEPISWQLSQMVIFAFVNMLGTETVTARVYLTIIVWFTYLSGIAFAQANQIIVGHLIGAGKEEAAYRTTVKSLKTSWIITAIICVLFALLRKQLFMIFTDNLAIIKIGTSALLIDMFLEMGRVSNLVNVYAFKAAGDVNFPVIVNIIFVWTVCTLGAYFLGIHLGLGLVGIWIAMAADELIRGFIMTIRLIKGSWRGKAIVD